MTAARLLPGPIASFSAPTTAKVTVPTSKSLTNRGLVCAAVAGGGTIAAPLDCEDTRLLAAALSQAGWPLTWDQRIVVAPRQVPGREVRLDLGNSGTGARFLLALLAAVPGLFVVDGTPRLRQRPMRPLLDALSQLRARVSAEDNCLPVTIVGSRLTGGALQLSPEVSSQFVSALLLAAPLMAADLDLEVSGPLPSRPYLDLTADVLAAFGGEIIRDNSGTRWQVAAKGLTPTTYQVEGDWSAAAFFLAAVAVAGGTLRLGPLALDSHQGDRLMCSVLEQAGLRIAASGRTIEASGPVVRPLAADLCDTPDLFPALAVVASCAPPGSRLSGLENLRHKESDRLSVMVKNLEGLGARLTVNQGTLTATRPLVRAPDQVRPVSAANDHRVAMAMAVAALVAGPLELDDGQCVDKSFPGFWETWVS